ncbi:MAG: bifunctional folylpolyglutamate synthase/dihydrofolate synthase [Peptococcaceae bacterium]|nr:bifunctional folylpolyglutamate synthase/dihydrofolate synthase [Peptococcaceae bacterium]
MNYQEAIKFIQNLAQNGSNLGLERVRRLLALGGNPEKALRTVHIGGTNGKGSVTAMLTAILTRAGYRVGSFTSPHLHSYTERFRIDGIPVSEERLASLIAEQVPVLKEAARDVFFAPTEFEIHAFLAFELFRREQVDLALLEVGLGGRLDATNVTLPEAAVITNVSLDHTDYLGKTFREIAREKAGIVKAGVPVVTGAQGEALEVIAGVCRDKGAPMIRLGKDIWWDKPYLDGREQVFNLYSSKTRYYNLRLGLPGGYQVPNAACAVAVIEVLAERDFTVSEQALRDGLQSVHWPGRFEILDGRPTIVLDGAHNPAGAKALRQSIQEYFPGHTFVMVLGVLADKDREGVVETLVPLARTVVVTRPPNRRAGDWKVPAGTARQYIDKVFLVEDVGQAVEKAVALSKPQDVVIITGSLYLLAAARAWLLDKKYGLKSL